nr:hypothetical protein [Bacillaceae bacterium]
MRVPRDEKTFFGTFGPRRDECEACGRDGKPAVPFPLFLLIGGICRMGVFPASFLSAVFHR